VEELQHEEVCQWADNGVKGFFETWKRAKKIAPFLVTWPNSPVKANNGGNVSGPCVLQLSNMARQKWPKLLIESVQLTDAFAVLLAEQRSDEVKVILESPHGARCWTLPIIRSGDVHRLGKAQVTNDKEHLGILWRPDRPEA
jgi:hypothetical protein